MQKEFLNLLNDPTGKIIPFADRIDEIISTLKLVKELDPDVVPEEKVALEISEILVGTDEEEVKRWLVEKLGVSEDQLIVKKYDNSKRVLIDGDETTIKFTGVSVKLRATNGLIVKAFSHIPKWLDKGNRFVSSDDIGGQEAEATIEDLENSMVSDGLIAGEEDDRDIQEKTKDLIEKLNNMPYLFGSIEELTSLLQEHFGDLASSLQLKTTEPGGYSLKEYLLEISYLHKDGSTEVLFSSNDKPDDERLEKAMDGNHFLDLSKLRGHLLRKGLELKKETVLKGTFKEIQNILTLLGVLESKYGDNGFIEEVDGKIAIGYYGGFPGSESPPKQGVVEFFQTDGIYEVDWSTLKNTH